MEVTLQSKLAESDLTILPLFKNQRLPLPVPALAMADFKNSPGSVHLVYSQDGRRLLLAGLGEKNQLKPETWRQALHAALTAALNLSEVETASILLPAIPPASLPQYLELAGFCCLFSTYQFHWYRRNKKSEGLSSIAIVAPANSRHQAALQRGLAIGEATNNARTLANHPGNIATPSHLAHHAVEAAKQYKFKCTVLGPAEIGREKLGLLAGVSKGSEEPAKFIILEYGPKQKKPIVLIGKGLTFDSGGISIKPADKMEEMKYDMCGGADVIGIFEAAARLKLPHHLIGLIPSAENLVSGSSVKPGDILSAHDGTSVEIINTDAEGRLVLADAISFAQKYYQPQLMIDYATLTGAVIQALGDQHSGYFSTAKKYDKFFASASEKTGEKFWALPLPAEYEGQLRSLTADIKNVGDKGVAGAITAGLFLRHFVKNNLPWIHLDIAGTAWTMRPKNYAAAGATGWGVYLTVEFLRQLR